MKQYVFAVALAFVTVPAFAASPVNTATYQLAKHPRCYAANGTVYVDGATAIQESGEPVQGAVVRVAIGGRTVMSTPTDYNGRYYASAKVSTAEGVVVREVATYLGTQTGSLVRQAAAQSFGGTCSVAKTSLGDLRQVHQ